MDLSQTNQTSQNLVPNLPCSYCSWPEWRNSVLTNLHLLWNHFDIVFPNIPANEFLKVNLFLNIGQHFNYLEPHNCVIPYRFDCLPIYCHKQKPGNGSEQQAWSTKHHEDRWIPQKEKLCKNKHSECLFHLIGISWL